MFIVFDMTATRSAAGLMEWENPSQALEALAACNHYVIRDAGTVKSLPDFLSFKSKALVSTSLLCGQRLLGKLLYSQ